MKTTVVPQLAAESAETAERLLQLSGEEGLDAPVAEYLLVIGLGAIQRVPRLWPIIKARIGRGTTGPTAHRLLTQTLDTVGKNLHLAGQLRTLVRFLPGELGCEPEGAAEPPATENQLAAELRATENQLIAIRGEVRRLLAIVGAPERWPDEQQLREARERMEQGDFLNAEQFRQSMTEDGRD